MEIDISSLNGLFEDTEKPGTDYQLGELDKLLDFIDERIPHTTEKPKLVPKPIPVKSAEPEEKWITWEEWSLRANNAEFDELRKQQGLKPIKDRELTVQLHLRACGLGYDEEVINEYDRKQRSRAEWAAKKAAERARDSS